MSFPPYVRWQLVGCCAYVDGRECDGEPPWTSIDAHAFDADGRAYALEVSTRDSFDRLVADDPEPCVPRLVDVVVPGLTAERAQATTTWEQPHVVIDAPWFDHAIVDGLVAADDDLRALLFTPMLTGVEQAWFEQRDEAIEGEQLPVAAAALALEFGESWRIEAGDAARAAAALASTGFGIDPTRLFAAHPDRFSNRARTVIREVLAGRRPR